MVIRDDRFAIPGSPGADGHSARTRILVAVIEDFWLNALYSLAPTVLVGLLFWFILRAIIRADRNERAVYADIESEERAKLGQTAPDNN